MKKTNFNLQVVKEENSLIILFYSNEEGESPKLSGVLNLSPKHWQLLNSLLTLGYHSKSSIKDFCNLRIKVRRDENAK